MVMTLTPLAEVIQKRQAKLRHVATALNVSHSQLSRVASGKKQASPSLAKKLSAYFDGAVSPDQILFPEEYADAQGKKPSRSSKGGA